MSPFRRDSSPVFYVDVRWRGFPRLKLSTDTTNKRRAEDMERTLYALRRAGRRDLLELLGRMDDAPSDEQLTRWLATLSDQELLAGVRKLQPAFNYEPDIARRNIAVLEAMRDDAHRFSGLDVAGE